jgi:hypothetical protein
MICALTHEECELRKSHIYPKFIWDFLKDKGGSRFRSVNAPTKVMQDGEKDYLLGNRAEQMFSLREKWFVEHIFMPFCNKTILKTKANYDNNLYYFIVSVLWRRFYTLRDYIKVELREQCMLALEEWREYLLNGVTPPKFNQIYMMPITPGLFFSPYFSFNKDFYVTIEDYKNNRTDFYPVTSYLLTDFDSEIYCAPNNYAFFCKIPRFFFWAVIERNDTELNFGIRVKPNGGTIDFKRYNIGNGEIKRFIFQRSYDAEQLYREAASKLSDKTMDKMLEHMKRKENIEHLKKSEMGELLFERVEYQSQLIDSYITKHVI